MLYDIFLNRNFKHTSYNFSSSSSENTVPFTWFGFMAAQFNTGNRCLGVIFFFIVIAENKRINCTSIYAPDY